MEESFLLKHYGRLSIDEQGLMTAEERAWWLKRLDQERERKEAASKNTTPGKLPETPGSPPA